MKELFISYYLAPVFFLFLMIFFSIYLISTKIAKKKRVEGKQKIYACGEDIRPTELNIPSESFYKVLVRVLGLPSIKKAHSGELTRYLTWIFVGMIALIVILVLLW